MRVCGVVLFYNEITSATTTRYRRLRLFRLIARASAVLRGERRRAERPQLLAQLSHVPLQGRVLQRQAHAGARWPAGALARLWPCESVAQIDGEDAGSEGCVRGD